MQVKEFKIGDEMSVDRDIWEEELKLFCTKKYSRERFANDEVGLQVERLRSKAEAFRQEGNQCPTITRTVLLRARSKIQNGKASGFIDQVVGEMIKLIRHLVMAQIVALFNLRLFGKHIETIESWRLILLVRIPKEKDFDSFVKFRGISLLSVMSKLYMACLMELYWSQALIIMEQHLQSGLRANHSCGEIIGAIAMLHRAGYEWRASPNLFLSRKGRGLDFLRRHPGSI